MTSEALHPPRLEKIDWKRLKELMWKGAKWAGPIATRAVLENEGVKRDIRNTLLDKEQDPKSKLWGAAKLAGVAAMHAVSREGVKKIVNHISTTAQNNARNHTPAPGNTGRTEQAPPTPEAKQATELKTRFESVVDSRLDPTERSLDGTRRMVVGKMPDMRYPAKDIRVTIYDDSKTVNTGAAITEHVKVRDHDATRVTEYSNLSDGVRVRITDFIEENPDLPAKIEPVTPVIPGAFGVPAEPDHLARLEQITNPDAMTQWQDVQVMPQANRIP